MLALTFSKCVVVFQIMDISLPFKIFKNNHIVYENMTPLATESREKGNWKISMDSNGYYYCFSKYQSIILWAKLSVLIIQQERSIVTQSESNVCTEMVWKVNKLISSFRYIIVD